MNGWISQLCFRAEDIVIAPDESGPGTNLLLLRSIALRSFRIAYDPDSYAPHVAAAEARRLAIRTFEDWQFAFDVDEPQRYASLRSWQQRKQGMALL
jgi:2-phospho-L-lactate guanylyltransferase (CobY/MobA/RfbA family)